MFSPYAREHMRMRAALRLAGMPRPASGRLRATLAAAAVLFVHAFGPCHRENIRHQRLRNITKLCTLTRIGSNTSGADAVEPAERLVEGRRELNELPGRRGTVSQAEAGR